MSHALVDERKLPLLDEQTARDNAGVLHRLGARHGITALRFASPGRLVGHVDEDRDMMDMADFMADVEDELGRRTYIISDRVLKNPGVSADVVLAQPL